MQIRRHNSKWLVWSRDQFGIKRRDIMKYHNNGTGHLMYHQNIWAMVTPGHSYLFRSTCPLLTESDFPHCGPVMRCHVVLFVVSLNRLLKNSKITGDSIRLDAFLFVFCILNTVDIRTYCTFHTFTILTGTFSPNMSPFMSAVKIILYINKKTYIYERARTRMQHLLS